MASCGYFLWPKSKSSAGTGAGDAAVSPGLRFLVPGGALWIPPDRTPGDSAAADSGWGDDAFWQCLSGPWIWALGRLHASWPGFPPPSFPSTLATPGPDLLGHLILPGIAHATSLTRRKSAPIWVRMSAHVLGGQLSAWHLLSEATGEPSQFSQRKAQFFSDYFPLREAGKWNRGDLALSL